MKLMVIGHPEAIMGFSLVGVKGTAATNADEVNQALDTALAAKDIGMILVTEDVAAMIESRMDDLKMHSAIPLVVEIPAPGPRRSDKPTIRDVVTRAIGVKI